jgi:exosortase/archaeosortase family protein
MLVYFVMQSSLPHEDKPWPPSSQSAVKLARGPPATTNFFYANTLQCKVLHWLAIRPWPACRSGRTMRPPSPKRSACWRPSPTRPCSGFTVALLQAQGFVLAQQGTFLVWRDEMIQFDAPCSGVNMLWAGLLLTLMGCVLFRLSAGKVLVASALSVVVIVACNVLRASSLFYLEAGLVPQAAGWWHEGIGIAAFMLSALVIVRLLGRLRNREAIAWAH